MAFIDILITLVLISIMFGVGTSLTTSDFRKLRKYPSSYATGMILQMIILPLIAFVIANLMPLSLEYKVGLFILALCPGGTTSNFVSFLVDANVALSVSLTTVNSFLILFTIPILTDFGLNYFYGGSLESTFELPIWDTSLRVFGIILTPAFLGFVFRKYWSILALKIQDYFKWINLILLALVYSIKFFFGESSGGSGISANDVFTILPWVLVLHFSSMFLSYGISRFFKQSILDATTIGIEVGLQNTTLALLITATLIGNEDMSKPALVTAVFAFFTTVLFSYLNLRYFGQKDSMELMK